MDATEYCRSFSGESKGCEYDTEEAPSSYQCYWIPEEAKEIQGTAKAECWNEAST